MTKDQTDWLAKSTSAAKESLKVGSKPKMGKKTAHPTNSKPLSKPAQSNWILPSSQSGVAKVKWLQKFLEEDSAAESVCKTEPKGKEAQLVGVVTKLLAEHPVEREGRFWAAQKKSWYCGQLGVSERQLQRIAAKAPLVSCVKLVDGERLVLMRPGPKTDRTAEHYARIMAKEWRIRVSSGKHVSSTEFGLLVGLAKDLKEFAPDTLVTVLENWSAFMAGVKLAIALAQVEGDHFESDPGKFMSRYFEYPSISVIRRFSHVAYELFEMLPKQGAKP